MLKDTCQVSSIPWGAPEDVQKRAMLGIAKYQDVENGPREVQIQSVDWTSAGYMAMTEMWMCEFNLPAHLCVDVMQRVGGVRKRRSALYREIGPDCGMRQDPQLHSDSLC